MNEILEKLINDCPALSGNKEKIAAAGELIIDCYKNGGILLCCGNGGSAADCEHIVGELMKGFRLERKPADPAFERLQEGLPAISLSAHTGLLTAFCNDRDPAYAFAQQVYAYGKNRKALLLALSTSGNSGNVVNAVKTAKALGIKSIAITGEKGGALLNEADVCINLPAGETYRVQELTVPVYHALCTAAEEYFFGE